MIQMGEGDPWICDWYYGRYNLFPKYCSISIPPGTAGIWIYLFNDQLYYTNGNIIQIESYGRKTSSKASWLNTKLVICKCLTTEENYTDSMDGGLFDAKFYCRSFWTDTSNSDMSEAYSS